jgi:hypothetical protein
VQLNDVIAQTSGHLPIPNCRRSFQKDNGVILTCAFPHFVHLEKGVFGNKKGFEMEQSR